MFAEKLCRLVKGISESVPMKTLSFVSDACQLLVQCHKVCTVCVSIMHTRMHYTHAYTHAHVHTLNMYHFIPLPHPHTPTLLDVFLCVYS